MTGERVTTEPALDDLDSTVPPEGVSGWAERQLAALRENTDRLRHEVDVLRSSMHEQQRTVAGLESTLASIEENTRRHETEQQALRTAQQRLQGTLEGAEGVISRLNERVQALEQRSWSADSMHGQRADADDAPLGPGRMEDIDNRIRAAADLAMQGRQAKERLDLALPELSSSISQLEATAETLRTELRRTGEEVAQERARRDREDELLELIDQQRAARVRLEERLAVFSEYLEEARDRLGAAAEERAALARQSSRTDERLLMVSEALDMLREAVVEHFQRLLDAERTATEKQIEGIEQRLREGQQLVTRLREGTDPHTAPEHPL
ncbi:MAG: hypothetical protein F4X26_07285 [Chloroflexi bacterium]|nr:hypothetical protein [Chloroflexota bacterium]